MIRRRPSLPADRKALIPKPIPAVQIGVHGLFGMTNLKRHMMAHGKWTPEALTHQFINLTNLLKKRMDFKRLQDKSERINYKKQYDNLMAQCHEGYTKLRYVMRDQDAQEIRALLTHDKVMQRLYSKMPIHEVDEKINHHTFVLRKERDRLQYQLGQLETECKNVLFEVSNLESRINYVNEFEIDTVSKAFEHRKDIENSKIRLGAIMTINGTYKKIIKILQHDANFYEPILASLNKDADDQRKYFRYLQSLYEPAAATMLELSDELRKLEENSRKDSRAKQVDMSKYRRKMQKTASASKREPRDEDIRTSKPHETRSLRYVRETPSMKSLSNRLKNIEEIIKMVKHATLCSHAKKIYPRMKSQEDNNFKLRKILEKDNLAYANMETKLQRNLLIAGVLTHNLTEEEIRRLNRTELYRKNINIEDYRTKRLLDLINARGKALALLRYSLWNLYEIVKYVGKPDRVIKVPYPNAYLKLPLLKFDNYSLRAVPPEQYEQNSRQLSMIVRAKTALLVKAFKEGKYTRDQIHHYGKIFIDIYEDGLLEGDDHDLDQSRRPSQYFKEEEEVVEWDEELPTHEVPSRHHIKVLSSKLHEEEERKKKE